VTPESLSAGSRIPLIALDNSPNVEMTNSIRCRREGDVAAVVGVAKYNPCRDGCMNRLSVSLARRSEAMKSVRICATWAIIGSDVGHWLLPANLLPIQAHMFMPRGRGAKRRSRNHASISEFKNQVCHKTRACLDIRSSYIERSEMERSDVICSQMGRTCHIANHQFDRWPSVRISVT
jgi:hypothetical protein